MTDSMPASAETIDEQWDALRNAAEADGVSLQEYIIRQRSEMQASLEQAIAQTQHALDGWEKAADLLEEHGILRPLPAAKRDAAPTPRMPKPEPWLLAWAGPLCIWAAVVCIWAAVGVFLIFRWPF